MIVLAVLATCGYPSSAWCGPQEIRQLALELQKAKNEYFFPGSGDINRNIQAALAKSPPGPGWMDWSQTGLPSFGQAVDLLDLLQAADALGFLDKRDATARQVLWEVAGRIRDTGSEDARWLRQTSRWFKASVPLPDAKSVLNNALTRSPELVALLKRIKTALRAEVLAGGPPPKGRPLLAERYLAYRKLMRGLDALEPLARDLESRYRTATEHNWLQRIRAAREWAVWRGDILGMAYAAGLTKDSPKHALEFARDFTNDSGWALEDIVETVCKPFDWKPPIPAKEQIIARDLCALIEAFHDGMYDDFLTLANRTWAWVPRF